MMTFVMDRGAAAPLTFLRPSRGETTAVQNTDTFSSDRVVAPLKLMNNRQQIALRFYQNGF